MLRARDDDRRLPEAQAAADVLRHGVDQEFAVAVDLHHVVGRAGVAEKLRPVERGIHLLIAGADKHLRNRAGRRKSGVSPQGCRCPSTTTRAPIVALAWRRSLSLADGRTPWRRAPSGAPSARAAPDADAPTRDRARRAAAARETSARPPNGRAAD